MTNTTYLSTLLPILQQVSKSLNFYFTVLILFPGVFLNLFTIGFLMRKRFWSNGLKMGFFYSLDATICFLVVAIGIVNYFPNSLGKDVLSMGTVWCKLIWAARYEFVTVYGYFSVFITLERTVSILNHRPVAVFSKYKYLIAITVSIWVIVALITIMNWWRYVVNVPTTSGNRTVFVPTCSGPSWVMISASMVGIFGRFIPPVANMTMNTLIIRALIKSKSRMRSSREESRISKKEYYFAFSLLANNFIFFVLAFPSAIAQALIVNNLFYPTTSERTSLFNLLFSLLGWGNYIYAALPFINNLAFNKIFRSELFGLFSHSVQPVSGFSSSQAPPRTL